MSDITVPEVVATTFDSFVSEDDPQTIDLHVYSIVDDRDRVTVRLDLSPERALELIQELARALSSYPKFAALADDIDEVVEDFEEMAAVAAAGDAS